MSRWVFEALVVPLEHSTRQQGDEKAKQHERRLTALSTSL